MRQVASKWAISLVGRNVVSKHATEAAGQPNDWSGCATVHYSDVTLHGLRLKQQLSEGLAVASV
jgi:hypothetical protein